MNLKLTNSQVRYLLVFSVIVNIAAFFPAAKSYVMRHFVQAPQKPPQPQPPPPVKISYLLDRQNVYKLFPVTSNDIVLAGDSHIQFYDSQEYLKDYKIVNRGIMGDNSAGLLNRFDELIKGRPKKLFIEIGLNDIRHKISQDSVLKNISLMFAKAKHDSPSTIVYMISIFPSSSMRNNFDPEYVIPVVNQKIKSLCSSSGITYIDVYTALSDKGSLNKIYDCGDRIHLNAEGFSVFTKILKGYL
jgi:lysophospholipase L1-like esterase